MQIFTALHAYGDTGLLVLRLAIGAIFLVHGLAKRAMWKMQPSEQMPAKMIGIMKLLSICEPLGAVAMFSGFLTQLAAVCLGIIMLGAINLKIKMMKKKFFDQGSGGGWELDFIILAVCVSLAIAGAGAFSLDRLLFSL